MLQLISNKKYRSEILQVSNAPAGGHDAFNKLNNLEHMPISYRTLLIQSTLPSSILHDPMSNVIPKHQNTGWKAFARLVQIYGETEIQFNRSTRSLYCL